MYGSCEYQYHVLGQALYLEIKGLTAKLDSKKTRNQESLGGHSSQADRR